MASVHKKKRSPFWHAAFYLPDGRRALRSTKQTNRTKAMEIAIAWSKASFLGSQQRLTDMQARRVIADIHQIATRDTLPLYTVESFLKAWMDSKADTLAERSLPGYHTAVAGFLEYLGPRAADPLDTITARQVLAFRAAMLGRVSASTANKNLLILRGAWTWGGRLSIVTENPFKAVGLATGDKQERRAFTLEELRALLVACNPDWRTMLLLGLYTGQRLGDLASITWRQIDLERKEVTFHSTQKTKRRMIIPIARPLAEHLLTLPSSDDPDAPVLPALAEVGTNTLSRQFGELLVGAGLVKRATTHRKREKGRDARRVQSDLSFHSLRHTATSLLKNAGASDVVAREIIGHDSEAVSRGYTHIETATLRKAVDLMPDLTAIEGATK